MFVEGIEIPGFIGGGLTVVTLAMRTMVPLRVVAIASNIFQISFGALAGVAPMLIQHSILLPLNAYRLYEQMRLVGKVRKATVEDLSMNWLMPYMTKRRVEAGEILFHKGQAADEMFIVISGRLRLSESALDVLPGSVVRELGLLAPNQPAFRSLQELKDTIHRFLDDTNANPKRFTWTKDPNEIIAAAPNVSFDPLYRCSLPSAFGL